MKKRFRIRSSDRSLPTGQSWTSWKLGSFLFTCAIIGFSWGNQLQLLVNITTLTTLNMEETVYQIARRLIPQGRRFDRDRFEVTWQKQSWFVKFSILRIHVYESPLQYPNQIHIIYFKIYLLPNLSYTFRCFIHHHQGEIRILSAFY